MPAGLYIRTKQIREKQSLSASKRKWSKKVKLKMSKSAHKRKWSDPIKSKMRLSHFKGGTKGYRHKLIERQKGKASSHICSCGRQAHDWSNIDHQYTFDMDDYIARCVSCHRKFDRKYNNAKTTSILLIN